MATEQNNKLDISWSSIVAIAGPIVAVITIVSYLIINNMTELGNQIRTNRTSFEARFSSFETRLEKNRENFEKKLSDISTRMDNIRDSLFTRMDRNRDSLGKQIAQNRASFEKWQPPKYQFFTPIDLETYQKFIGSKKYIDLMGKHMKENITKVQPVKDSAIPKR